MRIFFFTSQNNNIFFQSFSEKPSLFLELKVMVPVFYLAYLRKSETKSIFVTEAPVISNELNESAFDVISVYLLLYWFVISRDS